jgi:hypothetical protein
MRSLLSSLLLTAGLVAPPPLRAQRLLPFLTSAAQFDPGPAPHAPSPPFGHPADHRTEGMIAGAILIGIPTTILAFAFCSDTDSGGGNCLTGGVGVSLAGFLLGGLTGALIGSAIPKAQAPSAPASSFRQAPNRRLKLTGASAGQ